MLKRQTFGLTDTESVQLPGIDELFLSDEEQVEFTAEPRPMVASLWGQSKLGTLQSRLEVLQIRSGTKKYKYPNYMLLALANEVFGFEGWSTQILDLRMVEEHVDPPDAKEGEANDAVEASTERFTVVAFARVRIVLKDGTTHECNGSSKVSRLPERGAAYRTAKMSAVTVAIKNGIVELPTLALGYH